MDWFVRENQRPESTDFLMFFLWEFPSISLQQTHVMMASVFLFGDWIFASKAKFHPQSDHVAGLATVQPFSNPTKTLGSNFKDHLSLSFVFLWMWSFSCWVIAKKYPWQAATEVLGAESFQLDL